MSRATGQQFVLLETREVGSAAFGFGFRRIGNVYDERRFAVLSGMILTRYSRTVRPAAVTVPRP